MLQRLLLTLALGGVVFSLVTLSRERPPDPDLIRLSVRATVFAMPTAPPVIVEVTRVVEVTRLVEVVATPTPSPLPTDTPTPEPTPVAAAPDAPSEARVASAALLSAAIPPDSAAPEIETEPAPAVAWDATCPAASGNQYSLIPITGAPTDHPDTLHGDLNLALRGYVPSAAAATLISINGPTDGDPPQLGAAVPGSGASFTQAYRVRDWNWACGDHGCAGDELGQVEVSLLGIAATPGQPVSIPARGAEIYGGGYTALVVYADATRLTLVYTREDSVANGYTVHLEEICVDPNLLALYRSANQTGRGSLPGLRNGEIVGTAAGGEVAVAVRDRGWFADPRSAKDWWK